MAKPNTTAYNVRLAVEGAKETQSTLKEVREVFDYLMARPVRLSDPKDVDSFRQMTNMVKELSDEAKKLDRQFIGLWGNFRQEMADTFRDMQKSLKTQTLAMANVFNPVDMIFKAMGAHQEIRSAIAKTTIPQQTGSSSLFTGFKSDTFARYQEILRNKEGSAISIEGRSAALAGLVEGGAGVSLLANPEKFKEMLPQLGQAAAELTGSLDGIGEVSQNVSHYIDQLGDSMSDVSLAFSSMGKGAEIAGMSNIRFFKTINQGIDAVSMYGNKSTDLVRILSSVGTGASAIKNFQDILQTTGQMSLEARAFQGTRNAPMVESFLRGKLGEEGLDEAKRARYQYALDHMKEGPLGAANAMESLGVMDRLQLFQADLEKRYGRKGKDFNFKDYSLSQFAVTGGGFGYSIEQSMTLANALASQGPGKIASRAELEKNPKLLGALEGKTADQQSRDKLNDSLRNFSSKTESIAKVLENAATQLGTSLPLLDGVVQNLLKGTKMVTEDFWGTLEKTKESFFVMMKFTLQEGISAGLNASIDALAGRNKYLRKLFGVEENKTTSTGAIVAGALSESAYEALDSIEKTSTKTPEYDPFLKYKAQADPGYFTPEDASGGAALDAWEKAGGAPHVQVNNRSPRDIKVEVTHVENNSRVPGSVMERDKQRKMNGH